MANVVLKFNEMRQAMADGRLTITTGKDVNKGDVPNKHVHHKHALKRVGGNATEDFNITFPPLLVTHITKQIPRDSKYASYFVHGDIYPKWPLGKNRGEDAKGDELFDFLMDLESTYHKCLCEDEETKAAIFKHTSQEPLGRDGKKIPVTDIMSLINPIIQYPVFRDGHPQEKQRDDSKSPNFKIKLWDGKITAEKKYQIRPDSLLVNVDPMADPNGDPKDPSRFLQMIFTKIYDLRQQKNVMSDVYITKESDLDEFVYMAGDTNKGKSQSTMVATITVLAPTWYWETKKGASVQFKATTMEIFKKTALRRANNRSTEVKVSRYQEAMAAIADFGLDQVEDEEDGGSSVFDDFNDAEPVVPSSLPHQRNGGGNAVRQLNPSATVPARFKTNTVCVFPSKTSNITTSTTTNAITPTSTPPPEIEQSATFNRESQDWQDSQVPDFGEEKETEVMNEELFFDPIDKKSPPRDSKREEKQRQRNTKRSHEEGGNIGQTKENSNKRRRQ